MNSHIISHHNNQKIDDVSKFKVIKNKVHVIDLTFEYDLFFLAKTGANLVWKAKMSDSLMRKAKVGGSMI